MTDASSYCMCGTAQLDGKCIITVTLPSDTNETRFTDTIKMFDYSFKLLVVDTSMQQISWTSLYLSMNRKSKSI